LCVGQLGIFETILFLTNKPVFLDYYNGCVLDTYIVLHPPGGSAEAYGYWLEPAADGCSGLLFSGY
jgi:hypothetical protein